MYIFEYMFYLYIIKKQENFKNVATGFYCQACGIDTGKISKLKTHLILIKLSALMQGYLDHLIFHFTTSDEHAVID